MERILNPIRTLDRGEVYVTVQFDGERLSITGVEGPRSNGDALGGCGQINMSLREEDRSEWTYNAGWDAAMMDQLLKVWDRWHLNDTTAGTPEQEAFIRDVQAKHPEWRYEYTQACDLLSGAGLYVAEHPEQMVWGVGRGYRYGHSWLKETVPSEVIEFLLSLPESNKTPAWH